MADKWMSQTQHKSQMEDVDLRNIIEFKENANMDGKEVNHQVILPLFRSKEVLSDMHGGILRRHFGFVKKLKKLGEWFYGGGYHLDVSKMWKR